jgi:hypothetical protein
MHNGVEFHKATALESKIVVEMRMAFFNEYVGVQNQEADTKLRESLADYFTRELDKNYLCWFAKVDGEVASIAGLVIRSSLSNVRNPSGFIVHGSWFIVHGS